LQILAVMPHCLDENDRSKMVTTLEKVDGKNWEAAITNQKIKNFTRESYTP